MKRKIVSLLLAGCMVAKCGIITYAEELSELNNSETTVETTVDMAAVEPATEQIIEPTIETPIETTPVIESYDTTEPETEDNSLINGEEKSNAINNDNTNENDDNNVNASDVDTKTKESVDDKKDLDQHSEGDTRYEIITNNDGTQKKIIYEYIVDEDTGELIEIVKEEIEGKFDKDGNLIEDEDEENDDEKEDENIGKIISFESLESISFDHVPTMDELKESLPKTIVATIKGEDENTQQNVEIKFNDADLEEIVVEDEKNEDDVTKTYTLKSEVVTSIEILDGVSNPSLSISVTDPGVNYEYQELIDENTGICVKGIFPKNSSISIDYQKTPESIVNRMNALMESYSVEQDTCNTEFVDTSLIITIIDETGQPYDMSSSDKQAVVRIPLKDDSIEKIAGNRFTLISGEDEEIDHSFDKDAKVVEYQTNDFSKQITIIGTQTHYFYDVKFEVLSTTEDDFEFSSSYRAEKGSKITIPTFYSIEYPKLENLNWDNVDATVECDMVYTNYIDSTKYIADKGAILDDSVIETNSYGDKFVADGEDIEVNDSIDDNEEIILDNSNKEDDNNKSDEKKMNDTKNNTDVVINSDIEDNVDINENSNVETNIDSNSETQNTETKDDSTNNIDELIINKDDLILPESSRIEDDDSSETEN